jgi:hypothetical protein
MSEYRKLARLAARALYKHTYALERKSALARDNANASSSTHHHNFGRRMMEFPGLVEIVVDALTRRQWIREDDLAHALKLNPKQLRRVLRHLESLRVLTRSHVKERQALKEQRLVERGEKRVFAARFVIRIRIRREESIQRRRDYSNACSFVVFLSRSCFVIASFTDLFFRSLFFDVRVFVRPSNRLNYY